MFDYLIKQFQKILNNKDIREYKKDFFYYLLFRLVRKKLQENLKVKIYNFYIWASFQKNKQSHSILRKCDFEDQQELKLIENIYNNKKIFFFDCGANFGFYSLFTSALSVDNKIFSFEASPTTFDDLKKNVILNKFKNIELINKAISDRIGSEISFTESRNDWESSISNVDFKVLRSIKIGTITLDSFLAKQEEEFNNYNMIIKLDVEGHEMNVLKGGLELIKKHSPIIIIEFSKFIKKEDYTEIRQFLNLNSYVIYDSKYKEINMDTVKDRLNKLPKGMFGIGNNFLLKKNSHFENLIKDMRFN